MSIADKLTYLNTTKQLLKTEINKINNVLTDESTFRSYPQELFNGYLDILNNGTDTLWNNLEKVSQTGTETVLEGVETAPIKMVLNGNTIQESTTGKQLFDVNGTLYGGTIEKYNNGFKLTNNSDTRTLSMILPKPIATGTYKITYKIADSTLSNISEVKGSFRDNTASLQEIKFNISGEVSIVLPSEATRLYLYVSSSQESGAYITFDNFMISMAGGDYEPYTGGQPSPSPDYPQQVKVVTGENVVSVQGKNLFDKDNQAKVQVNAEGTLRYGIIVNAPNKKVSISGKNWSGYIVYKPLTNGVYGQWVNTNRDTTINVTDKLIIYSNGDTIKLDTYVDDLQIEISDTPTSYVPYSKTDYTINLGDIELCKINTYKDYFHKDSGKWYVHKELGKVVLNGSENWDFASKADTPTPRSVTLLASYIDFQSLIYYSNYFTNDDENTSNRLRFYVQQSNYRKDIYLSLDNEVADINSSDSNATRLQKIKTWLSTHNTIVYYILATPTEEEITNNTLIEQLEAISKAKSVKDKTYITQTNDELPFILDVEAIKEYNVE